MIGSSSSTTTHLIEVDPESLVGLGEGNISYRQSVLYGICNKIKSRDNHEIIDDDFAALFTVYEDLLFNALEIIDNELIEKVTIRNTPRCYFLVTGSSDSYMLYEDVIFCQCKAFRNSVERNSNDATCKHILACALANVTNKFKERTCQAFPTSSF